MPQIYCTGHFFSITTFGIAFYQSNLSMLHTICAKDLLIIINSAKTHASFLKLLVRKFLAPFLLLLPTLLLMACQCYCLAGRAPHPKTWTSMAHSIGAEESQHHVTVYSATA
jgi:hypothetical protein